MARVLAHALDRFQDGGSWGLMLWLFVRGGFEEVRARGCEELLGARSSWFPHLPGAFFPGAELSWLFPVGKDSRTPGGAWWAWPAEVTKPPHPAFHELIIP